MNTRASDITFLCVLLCFSGIQFTVDSFRVVLGPCPNLHLFALDLDIQYRAELDRDPEVNKVKVVTQCYSSIEASSNAAEISKMTNGETSSFWQSDGSARSHWIRQEPVKHDLRLCS